MLPKLIIGGNHSDSRGTVRFNRNFDSSSIKRLYIIENENTEFIRGWQGHKIEQRWFSVIQGSFKINLIAIDNWEFPSINLKPLSFVINAKTFDVLHVPKGYVSSIQAIEKDSKLLLMSDYLLGEIDDEYRYEIEHFKI